MSCSLISFSNLGIPLGLFWPPWGFVCLWLQDWSWLSLSATATLPWCGPAALGLSVLLLTTLLLSSLRSLLFLGHRGSLDCLLRQVALSITFTVAISCVLARTAAVLVAFRAVQQGGSLQMCLGPGLPRAMVTGPLLAQVCICVFWLGVTPQTEQKPIIGPQHSLTRVL